MESCMYRGTDGDSFYCLQRYINKSIYYPMQYCLRTVNIWHVTWGRSYIRAWYIYIIGIVDRCWVNHIGSVMVGVLASRAVDCASAPRSVQTRDQDNVSESTRGLLFQWASTIQIQLSVLVLHKGHIINVSFRLTCSRHDIDETLLSWR